MKELSGDMKNNTPPKTIGLVLGKFLPLHQGHELLLRFAAGMVDKLYIVVDWNKAIPIEKRCRWVRETVPQAEVIALTLPHPQAPEEHPNFWDVWQESLLSMLPEKPSHVIASEQYGFTLAEVLGARFVPFDFRRESLTISGTQVRASLFEMWDYLSAAAKRDYLARVCICGPESSGKSTLAGQLAAHYGTVFVPEYARFYIETRGRSLTQDDMLHIAKGQRALEDALAPRASRLLFCDTDPLATTVWSRWLFGACAKELEELALQKTYPLYLLMEPDIPWQKDEVRYFPGKGAEFMTDCKALLDRLKRPYVVINGQGQERLGNALRAIEDRIKGLFVV